MRGPIVVLGARGMLGTEVTARFRAAGREVCGYDVPEWDLTKAEDVAAVVRPGGVLVNCAAYTDVEGAEREPDVAEEVNARAVGRLGHLAREREASVVHISTDFVFDGRLERAYVETDEPNALSAYGRSKLGGEQALQASGCVHCIVRVQWTYGAAGQNFVTKILDRARQGAALRVVDDQVGSPTWTRQVAEVLLAMLGGEAFPEGLFHVAASGYASRYEVARFVLECAGLDVPVEPCSSADFAGVAVRPKNSRFDCAKIEQLLGRPLAPWQEGMTRFVEVLCDCS